MKPTVFDREIHMLMKESVPLGKKRHALMLKVLRQALMDNPEEPLVEMRLIFQLAADHITNHIMEKAMSEIEMPTKTFFGSSLLPGLE